MANKTRSHSDAARIKRGTLSVKAERQHPFVLSFSYPAQAGGGLKRNMKRMK